MRSSFSDRFASRQIGVNLPTMVPYLYKAFLYCIILPKKRTKGKSQYTTTYFLQTKSHETYSYFATCIIGNCRVVHGVSEACHDNDSFRCTAPGSSYGPFGPRRRTSASRQVNPRQAIGRGHWWQQQETSKRKVARRQASEWKGCPSTFDTNDKGIGGTYCARRTRWSELLNLSRWNGIWAHIGAYYSTTRANSKVEQTVLCKIAVISVFWSGKHSQRWSTTSSKCVTWRGASKRRRRWKMTLYFLFRNFSWRPQMLRQSWH